MKKLKLFSWLAQIVVAVILIQSLYFKFTGQPISKELFSMLGVEPWGRILTGVLELVAGILILIPATIIYGAILSLIIISGAIVSHLFVIGISFGGDSSLFLLAVLVFVLSVFVIFAQRKIAEADSR